MSGFPGQHGYGEFAAHERRRDIEVARNDIPPVERSAEMHGLTDSIALRIRLLGATKADMMTQRDLDRTVRVLEAALGEIERMGHEIAELRQQARKAGDSEGK